MSDTIPESFIQSGPSTHNGDESRRIILDARRYRWLRSEKVNTDPRYYEFWNDFQAKLCREEKMDELIDIAMAQP